MHRLLWRLGGRKKLTIGAVMLALLVFGALAAGLSPYDPNENSLTETLQPPSWSHPFGTDDLGRDIFTRVLYAGRIDLTFGVLAVVAPFVIGTMIGLAAGFFGGWVDSTLMRLTDIVHSFPFLVLAIVLVAIIGPGIPALMFAIVLAAWTPYARIVRAETLVARGQAYVLAARVLGYGPLRVLGRHILPNTLSAAVVYSLSDVVLTILLIASMSFLGLGVQPPTAEWGALVSEGRAFLLQAWWIATLPGIAVIYASFAFGLIGDGLAELLGRIE